MTLEQTPLVDLRQILMLLHSLIVLLLMAFLANLLVNQVLNLVKDRWLDNRCDQINVG
jgi:hypothetical protein